jgi:hypothetical protein
MEMAGHIILGVVVLVGLYFVADQMGLLAFGDTVSITNKEATTIRCQFPWLAYNAGKPFDVAAGKTFSLPLDRNGQVFEGWCWCGNDATKQKTLKTGSYSFSVYIGCDGGSSGGGETTTTPGTTNGGGMECTDSDDGKNYNKQGTVRQYSGGVLEFRGNDNCLGDDKTVSEYYCSGDYAKGTTYLCPNGCQGGQCIVGVPDTCANHGLASEKTYSSGYICSEKWIDGVGWCYSCKKTGTTTTTTKITTTTTPPHDDGDIVLGAVLVFAALAGVILIFKR